MDLVLTLNQTSSDLPQVEVMSNENKIWLPAYITSFDGDKFCNVIFDDGQLETSVTMKNIRLIDGHETFDGLQGGSDILVEGSAVDARYKGSRALNLRSAMPNVQSAVPISAFTERILTFY